MSHNYIKKAQVLVFSVLMSCMLIFPSTTSAQTKNVEIKAGTPVELITKTKISSKTNPQGTTVELELVNPVVVDGELVIPAGTLVKGRVSQCQKSKLFGGKGMIAIEVNSIPAIDGTMVPITGASFQIEGKSRLGWSIVGTVCCLFGFLIRGTQGVIPAGVQLPGNVMANTTVRVSAPTAQ